VVHLREEKIQYFSDTEEELFNLLTEIGTKKNVAKLLVFFTGTPVATSHEIERAMDLRQPEVSIAVKYLTDQGWIREQENPSESKGRPQKKYSLAVPVKKIFASIEKEKKDEANNKLALIKKIKSCL
jgi:predicted transcriptional regulator